MTMRWMVTVAGLTAALTAGPALAHDTDAPNAGRGKGQDMAERMGKRLDLTPDQQSRIKALNEAHWAAMKPKHEAQRALVKDLRELVKTKAADSAITAKLDAIKAGHQAIEAAQQAHQDAVAAILTPMQKAKFVLWLVKKIDTGMDGMHGGDGKDWKNKKEGHDGKDDDD